MEKDPELTLSEKVYEKYKVNQRGTWATRCMGDRAFKAGAMWKQSDDNKNTALGQISPITNEIIPTIDLVVAQLTENSPRFFAVGRERSDVKVASAIADLMAYIWYISKGDEHNEQVTTDFEDIGAGVWVVYIDPHADSGKGEIKVMSEDPLSVYVSPSSKDPNASDSPHILIVKHLDEETIKSSFPNMNLETITAMIEDDLPTHDKATPEDQTVGQLRDDSIKYYRIIDRYTKTKEKRYHVYDPQSDFERTMNEKEYIEWSQGLAVILTRLGQEEYITENSKVEYWLNMVRTIGNVYHEAIDPQTGQLTLRPGVEEGETAIPGSTTQIKVTNRAQFLQDGIIKYNTPYVDRIRRVYSIGNKVVANYIMEDAKGALEDYPIIFTMLHHSRNPFPMGDIALVKSLQEQLNKIDNLIITYNQNITNVKGFVPKGTGLKKELDKTGSRAGSQWYEYDPELGGVPIMVQLTQMSSSLYQQRENLIRQIQRVVGAYSMQDGDVASAPQTKGGTILMDEMMQRRTARKRRKLERALNQVGKVVAQMIPMVYDQRKIFRVVKPNHLKKDKEVIINDKAYGENGDIQEILNDVTSSRYDIQVISGSMLPINRMQRREEKLRLYEIGMLKDPEWYIRDMDEPDVDEILERENLISQAQGQIQQLQEKIKELEGDLQTADRAEVQSRKKVEVEKFKTKLNTTASNLEAKTVIASQRMNDEVKKQKTPAQKPA